MGAARINSSLLDLKFHSAASTLKITNYDGKRICTKGNGCDCLILVVSFSLPSVLACFHFHFYVAYL